MRKAVRIVSVLLVLMLLCSGCRTGTVEESPGTTKKSEETKEKTEETEEKAEEIAEAADDADDGFTIPDFVSNEKPDKFEELKEKAFNTVSMSLESIKGAYDKAMANPAVQNGVNAVKDNVGKAMNKVQITLKVKGKTYKATTNAKGKATFKIKKLTKKGTYKAIVTFKGNGNYNKITKTVKIKVK